jgi:hypothetical protein
MRPPDGIDIDAARNIETLADYFHAMLLAIVSNPSFRDEMRRRAAALPQERGEGTAVCAWPENSNGIGVCNWNTCKGCIYIGACPHKRQPEPLTG